MQALRLHKMRRVLELRAVDEGAVPASAPATSQLFVLAVAIRRWVLTVNRSVGWSQDNDEASFDDFTRLFATPAQDDDPSLHTPVALLRHPARDVRPPDCHSYPTYHVHAQRKRGRNGRGG